MSVLGPIVVSLIVGGCMTQSVMKVGSAHEMPAGYREVQLPGTTLQVRYKTTTWFERPIAGTGTEYTPDRWTSVSLDSLPWLALDRLEFMPPFQKIPLDCSATRSTPEPAPAMTLHASTWPFKRWYSPDAPDYQAPIAAYVDQHDRRVLVLVRASSSDGQKFVTSLYAVNQCHYDLPWAPYARAALVPFAVVADIVTFPFQALYFLLKRAPSH